MVYDYNQMTSNIPQSSSLSCLDFVNDPCSRACSSNCCCHPCGINSMLNDHTYTILKRVCRKIIKDYNRNCCSEKYTVFDGGNSVNVRIHRSSTVSCGKSDRRQRSDEFDSSGTQKRGISSGRIEMGSRPGDKNVQKGGGGISVNVKKRQSRRDVQSNEGETGGKRSVKQAKSKRKSGDYSAEGEEERGGKKSSQSVKKQIKRKGKASVGEDIGDDFDSNKKLKNTDTESGKKGKKDKNKSLNSEEDDGVENGKKGKKGKNVVTDGEDNVNSADNKKKESKKGKKSVVSGDEDVDSGKKGKKDKKRGAEAEDDDDVVTGKKGKKGKKSIVSDDNDAESDKKNKKDKKKGAEPEDDDNVAGAKKGKKGKKSVVPDDEDSDGKKLKKGQKSVSPDVDDKKDKKTKQKTDEDDNSKKAKNVKSKSMVPDDNEDVSKEKPKADKKKAERTASEYALDSKKENPTKKSSADLPIVKDLRSKVRKGIDVLPTSKYKDDGEITLENAVGRKSSRSKGKSPKVLGSRPTKTTGRISKARISSMGSRLQSDTGCRRFPPSRSDQARPCDYLRANMEQREVCGMLSQTQPANQTCMVPQCTYQCFPRPLTCVC